MSRRNTPDVMTAATWTLAGALAVMLSASWLLDGPSDIQAAQDVAEEAEYAAALADGGVAKCGALGRIPLWTADGSLICRQPQSQPQTVAQSGQP